MVPLWPMHDQFRGANNCILAYLLHIPTLGGLPQVRWDKMESNSPTKTFSCLPLIHEMDHPGTA